MSRTVTVIASEVEESIIGYEVLPEEGQVRVSISNVEDFEMQIPSADTEPSTTEIVKRRVEGSLINLVTIEADYYTALMSGEPSWNPTKPVGMFSMDDLWIVIDAIRASEVLSDGTKMKKFIL
jgi:hypothetical protein